MPEVTVQTGEYLYEFSSFIQWVNKAKSWFRSSGLREGEGLYVDPKGRICTIGKHFAIARDEDAFPVKVDRKRDD